jgi:hypothetical protein
VLNLNISLASQHTDTVIGHLQIAMAAMRTWRRITEEFKVTSRAFVRTNHEALDSFDDPYLVGFPLV